MRRVTLAFLPLLMTACSAGRQDDPPGVLGGKDAAVDGSISIDAGTLDGGGIGLDGELPPEGGITAPDCPEDLKQIFAISNSYVLYRFDPAKLTMTTIGNVKCPGAGINTPFSMAVDRKGTGWVLYDDGRIFHVSTKDASCKATSFAPDQAGFHTFGMAFASDGVGSTGETLYVANYDGSGIAKINTTTLKLSPIGGYGDPSATAAELSGTGDARLFAFFNATPTRVAEIDRATGKIKSQKPVSGVTVGLGWAFAHWGGDFWLFTAPGFGSQVTQFDFTKGTGKTVVSGLTYTIVGAGVSTCAPTVPPPK